MMVSGDIIPVMLVLAMLCLFYENNIMVEGRNFSQEEHLKMKAHLNMMNKPSVMSIKTEDGDLYDCVDIYKQPAFDHPLLKNHTLQMEPTSYLNGEKQKNINYDIHNIGFKNLVCPNGTVPIRRTRESDLLMPNRNFHFGVKGVEFRTRFHAFASTPMFGQYYGTRAIMNIWQPKVYNAGSYTTSQLWIVAGAGSELNTIEVGLMVDQKFYGDSKIRLFIEWTRDTYISTGCANMRCPGFIQVNRRIPIDGSFDRVSSYKGKQYEVQFDVLKDPKSGNWFLLKDDITIGYWPSVLFNHLNTKADLVSWGGEVNQCGGCPLPQMGSGHVPDGGYGVASYMKGLQVIDNTNMVLKDPKNWFINETNKNYYRIQHNPRGKGPLIGYHIFYGGPNGAS